MARLSLLTIFLVLTSLTISALGRHLCINCNNVCTFDHPAGNRDACMGCCEGGDEKDDDHECIGWYKREVLYDAYFPDIDFHDPDVWDWDGIRKYFNDHRPGVLADDPAL
ncbi:hypothetical protein K458DRAFT_389614 [Lentithecium fluviatile CBS 122367]|uniref:Uncharacterized protein n=1 Tax=Lentithecium fluviatile CBS 122367 TaxID=1168545 RepID=A0A6G1J023_9PLEO|nr:hypothetical protein K458DRAFT_389614 [Lentithecium fluviatile CBS 122367]